MTHLTAKPFQVAGRIMSKRGMGKAIFCHIQGRPRHRSSSTSAPMLSAQQEFADFRKYDIGDIIGVSGYVFKTKTEEISSSCTERRRSFRKSLRPLPEKFHGMTNTELQATASAMLTSLSMTTAAATLLSAVKVRELCPPLPR